MCIGVALFDDDIYIYILGPELSFTFGHDGWAGDVKKDVNPQTARPSLPTAVKRGGRDGGITDYDYDMLCYAIHAIQGQPAPMSFEGAGRFDAGDICDCALRCCVFVAPLVP